MVRLTTISNLFSGIGITIVAFSGGIFYLLQALATTPGTEIWLVPLYLWLAGVAILCLVLLMSVVTTFTEMTGFVHP